MRTCLTCGAAVPDDAKFCPTAGGGMGEKLCPACGTHCQQGARFCPHCGAALGAGAVRVTLPQVPARSSPWMQRRQGRMWALPLW